MEEGRTSCSTVEELAARWEPLGGGGRKMGSTIERVARHLDFVSDLDLVCGQGYITLKPEGDCATGQRVGGRGTAGSMASGMPQELKER